MGRGKGGSVGHNKRTPGGIRTSSKMSKVGEIEAKHGVLGDDTTAGSPELNNEYQLPDGATLNNAKIYDKGDAQDPINNVNDLVKGFLKGDYLVHARVKDGTDHEYGIDPSAGEFLRSTDSWQTAQEMHNRETELTFFGDKDSGLDSWAKHFAEKGKPIEMVFVKKEPNIVKSLGNGMVETAEGKEVPYELSEVADYEDERYRDLPAGVETGDWFTKDTQPVVGVVDYTLPPTEQKEALTSADFTHDLGDNVKTKKTIEPNRIEVLGKYEPDINFNDKTVAFDATPPEAEEGYLYHSTFAQNVDPILNEGIVPNKSNNWEDWSEKGYSYFAKSPEDALQWAKDLYEEQLRDTGDVKEVDDIAILKVKLDNAENKVIEQYEADSAMSRGWRTGVDMDDVNDAIDYIQGVTERDVVLSDDAPTFEYMNPEDFVSDTAWFENTEKGFLKDIPESDWNETLRSEFSRPFEHIVEQKQKGELAPGIMVDDEFGDGKGRAIFAWSLGEKIPVAKYTSEKADGATNRGESLELQKQWEEENDTEWDEDEYGEFPAHTSDIVKEELAPYIVEAAQKEYDKWDEEDVDTYANGGICHYIAEKIADLLSNKGINAFTVSSNFEQHVYVVAQFADGVYSVDIPHQYYETGGGFSWKKLPDVEFSPEDISMYHISGDPRDIKEQQEEF